MAERILPQDETQTVESKQLRDTGLWYPTVPDPEIYVNDETLMGEDPTAGYRPLFWTRFGGPNGIYLRSLIEVSVTTGRNLRPIEFRYDSDKIPAESFKLGRCKLTDLTKVMRFPIDGPGGEVINNVDVGLEHKSEEGVLSFFKHGKLSSFKVSQVWSL